MADAKWFHSNKYRLIIPNKLIDKRHQIMATCEFAYLGTLSSINKVPDDSLLTHVPPGTLEYELVACNFAQTGMDIKSIRRIHNPILAERFNRIQQLTGETPVTLFHGTRCQTYEDIALEGLDQRLAKNGYFGRGLHFADEPIKSGQYTLVGKDGLRTMFAASVLLGRSLVYPDGVYNSSLQREPAGYDSVQGCVTGYREYIVYDNSRVLLDYEIRYVCPSYTNLTTSLEGGRTMWRKMHPGRPLPEHLTDILALQIYILRRMP
jgi:hypothetical protein